MNAKETIEPHKLAEIRSRQEALDDPAHRSLRKPFGPEWGPRLWGKWATLSYALSDLGVVPSASVLDIGCGTGWTTLFLSEYGYEAIGVDIAPGNLTLAQRRRDRWQSGASFVEADMDYLDLERRDFDAALVFDSLHHSTRQREVVSNIAKHLRPGGWLLLGEPSWLHGWSPNAWRVHRDEGWVERGIRLRRLREDCRAAGLGNFRRFFEGSAPYSARITGLTTELARLVLSQICTAPQISVWLAAQKV